jgi:hypothetical protein
MGNGKLKLIRVFMGGTGIQTQVFMYLNHISSLFWFRLFLGLGLALFHWAGLSGDPPTCAQLVSGNGTSLAFAQSGLKL